MPQEPTALMVLQELLAIKTEALVIKQNAEAVCDAAQDTINIIVANQYVDDTDTELPVAESRNDLIASGTLAVSEKIANLKDWMPLS